MRDAFRPDEERELQEEVTLDGNIHLDFHSVSGKQGHFGCSTEYIASERRVVHKRWGARRRFFGLLPPKIIGYEPEYLDVPERIATEEQLMDYIDQERVGWLMGRYRERK